MNLEPGQEVFEVMIAANKVGLVIGMNMSVQPQNTLHTYVRTYAHIKSKKRWRKSVYISLTARLGV